MAETKKPNAKKRKYQITAVRTQYFEFDVTAMSPEGARKQLRERLKRDTTSDMPIDARPVLSSWSDPNCRGEEWIVEGGDLPRDATMKTVLVWNGIGLVRIPIPKRL